MLPKQNLWNLLRVGMCILCIQLCYGANIENKYFNEEVNTIISTLIDLE